MTDGAAFPGDEPGRPLFRSGRILLFFPRRIILKNNAGPARRGGAGASAQKARQTSRRAENARRGPLARPGRMFKIRKENDG